MNEYSSIFRIKHELYKKYGIDIESQQLRYNGSLLNDNHSIVRYNLNDTSTIDVNLNKLRGGGCGSKVGTAVLGGIGFLIMCMFGLIPILVRVYWLLLVNMFNQAKDLLCKYNRLGASIIGAVIGFLIMSGFVHIHNDNTNMYLWGIPLFMLIFGFIGSRRIISFFEPMFRKKCIYLDPTTRTIRKCTKTSPAHIGFLFIRIIRFFMACIRCAFMFIMVFVISTYLELAAINTCDNYCDSLELAKRVGKITTYVFVGFYVLFNLPNYLISIGKVFPKEMLPFSLLYPAFKTLSKKIKEFANIGKYYISGLYLIPFIGTGFQSIHKLIDKFVDTCDKYINDFDGYNCRVNLEQFVKREQDLTDALEEQLRDNQGKQKTPQSLTDWINKHKAEFYKYIGTFDTTSEETKFKEGLDAISNNFQDETPATVQNVKPYITQVFNYIVNRKKDLKQFMEDIQNMSDPVKKILKKFFMTDELKQEFVNSSSPELLKELEDSISLKQEDLKTWLQDKDNIQRIMYKKFYCMSIYFINLFNVVVNSFGNVDNMKNEMKVSNVAGSACFFAWMVMAILVSVKVMK
jgi:hypothetical protein